MQERERNDDQNLKGLAWARAFAGGTRPPSEIKLVIFDWAGTTIDFGCMAPVGAFVEAFWQRGVEVSLAEARRPMGLHKKAHIRAMLEQESIAERWKLASGRIWRDSDVDDLYQIVTPLQVAAARMYSDLTPGVIQAVEQLRSYGVRIAGTTGYFREASDVVASEAARQGYRPDVNICADEVPSGRPAPWMIFRAMEATGIYPPAAVVKVGDTLIDIADGLNAGVWSVGVIDSSNEMGLSETEFASLSEEQREIARAKIRERYLEAGAHGAINSLLDLPKLIEGLWGAIPE